MIEFSITDLVLFCWAVGATAAFMHYKQEHHKGCVLVRAMLESKDLRDRLVEEFYQHKKARYGENL